MKGDEDKLYTRYKYACALNKLLEVNKIRQEENRKSGIEDLMLNHSYDKISSDSELRVATISNIFNGMSDAKMSSVDLILKSLGASYSRFGEIMDSLTEDEVLKFKEKKEKKSNKK